MPEARAGIAYSGRAMLSGLPILASDILALLVAWSAGVIGDSALTADGPSIEFLPAFFFLVVAVVVAGAALGLYPGTGLHGIVELRQSVTTVFLVFGGLSLAEWFRGEGASPILVLLIAGAVAAVCMPLLRMLTRELFSRTRWWPQPMLVVGSRGAVTRIVRHFEAHLSLGLRPIATYGEGAAPPQPATIARMAREHQASFAAIAFSGGRGTAESFLIRYCSSLFPSLLIVPETGITPNLWTRVTGVGELVGIQATPPLLQPLPRAFKRAMDLVLASLMALLSLPLFTFVALAVRLTSPGPLFYSQERVGRGRRSFRAWKFRTMYANADEVLKEHLANKLELRREWARDHKLRDDPRITPVGRVLRRASLDELPQLWNIIRGDMSLVGPRPIVTQEIPRYGPEFALYLSVPPGLTGLWQVSGRSRTTYEERVAYDAYYVQNWSVWMDLHILIRTVRAVLTADGAC